MGKMIFLSMVTIDGCVSNLAGIREWGLKRDMYGITELYDNADALITKGMNAEIVETVRKNAEGYCLYEPEPDMGDLTREMFKRRIVDELYLYVFSYTVGSGIPLLSHDTTVANYWKLKEAKVYNEEIVLLHYRWLDDAIEE